MFVFLQQEVAKNRKLQLDMRLREDDARHVILDKEEQIATLKNDLLTSTKQVDAVKTLLLSATSFPQAAAMVQNEFQTDLTKVPGETRRQGAKRSSKAPNRYSTGDENTTENNTNNVYVSFKQPRVKVLEQGDGSQRKKDNSVFPL